MTSLRKSINASFKIKVTNSIFVNYIDKNLYSFDQLVQFRRQIKIVTAAYLHGKHNVLNDELMIVIVN